MTDGVQITLIICATLIAVSLIGKMKGGDKK